MFLILAALVVVFGLGVVINNRRQIERGRSTLEPARPADASVGVVEVDETGVDEIDIAEIDVVEIDVEVPEPEPVRRSLRDRLAKARATLSGAFGSILGRSTIDQDTWDDLEEALLSADVGLDVTDGLIDSLKARVDAKEIEDGGQLLAALKADMVARLGHTDRSLHYDDSLADGEPNVWMFVGVNGVGKTTTIGKLARQQVDAGRSALLAAGDTFRAAAAEQLETWAGRADADYVRGAEGGDPASVIFDATERAASRNIDLVFADTAGRLHNKQNLMDELSKVRRVAEKGAATVTETLLVIDATTGQNGLSQAEVFAEATDVTGVVLTKLDGSAKGGIVFAIETKLGIPVKLVGVGEQIGDLMPFDPDEFVSALFE